jgi:hypothetical protein
MMYFKNRSGFWDIASVDEKLDYWPEDEAS